MQFKICSVCREEKNISNFSKNKPTSYRSQCKSCFRLLQKQHEKELIQQHLRVGIDENAPKTCARCKIEKIRRDFHMDRSKKSGVCSACKECAIKKAREFHAKRKESPESSILQHFGITASQKSDLFIFQGSVCAVCQSTVPKNKRGWALDHCHKTKEIRGVLCGHCNSALGLVADSKEVLSALIAYLTDFPARKFFGEPKMVVRNMKIVPRRPTTIAEA